jgi:putative tricarboxylic transport membrane protein
MRRHQLWASVFWLALGVFVCFYSYWRGLGHIRNPGPGLFPFCLGLAFFIISGVILTQILIKGEASETEKEKEGGNFLNVIVALVVLFAYALFLEMLGYILITLAAMAVLFRIGGYKKIIPILGYSTAIAVFTYLFFTYLGVQLPSGVLRLPGLY